MVERIEEAVLGLVGDAWLVLLGEASHGTHEFYAVRAGITKRLIADHGFTAVACEADWPDAYRVNRYVHRRSDDATAEEALRGFQRFPQWMWRNTVVVEFVEWVRDHNASARMPAGFYGLDLYSMYTSMESVVSYLERVDREAAARARERYACFDWVGKDPQHYGYATAIRGADPCEDDVIRQLAELSHLAPHYASLDGRVADEDAFAAKQNARLAVNAERYYREMYYGGVSSWNLRDSHMVETLSELVEFLGRHGNAKVVVWTHNSHLGDARATEMGWHGEHNVGQLVRERWGAKSRLIGFTTHSGTVTAASDWGGPAEAKHVRPSMDGSYESHFHSLGEEKSFVNLRDDPPAELRGRRLERAIGVIYRPETERQSHYFYAVLPDQFDGVIHIDETTALEPLEGWAPIADEPPKRTRQPCESSRRGANRSKQGCFRTNGLRSGCFCAAYEAPGFNAVVSLDVTQTR